MPVQTAGPPVLHRRGWLLNFGVWTVFGLISASQQYYFAIIEKHPTDIGALIVIGLLSWWYFALVTPLIFRLGRRVPIQPIRASALAVHTAAAVGLAIGHAVLVVGLAMALTPALSEAGFFTHVGQYLVGRITLELVAYAAILGVGHGVELYRRMREREVTAARLEAALAQAQLQALKMQLHPHFLFNTLHAISVLIREDPAAATRTVTLLGDLLRHTLAHANTEQVPLSRELEFLQLYLEIERTRFHDRLTVEFDVPAELLEAPVPQFVLQPLVENAIRHGISRRAGAGRIIVRGRRDAGLLKLTIWNEGPRLGEPAARSPDPVRASGGVGLATTRTRLEKLYPGAGGLTLEDAEGGVMATVTLPAETEPAGEARDD